MSWIDSQAGLLQVVVEDSGLCVYSVLSGLSWSSACGHRGECSDPHMPCAYDQPSPTHSSCCMAHVQSLRGVLKSVLTVLPTTHWREVEALRLCSQLPVRMPASLLSLPQSPCASQSPSPPKSFPGRARNPDGDSCARCSANQGLSFLCRQDITTPVKLKP